MKLQAEIGEEKYQVEVRREGTRVFADIEGRQYELEASEPEPNVFLLKHEGRVHEIFVSPPSGAGEPLHVRAGTHEIDVRIIDPKRLRGTGVAGEHAGGVAEIKTAMPGKVVRILVSVGDSVSKGDGVIVVEAMKMQNEMKSPKDGVVSEIRVAESDTVSASEVLMVIE
jgi:biotin carboxyl carrier protein